MKVFCKYDELVPVEDLKPYPRNRNTHSPEQVERLAFLLENHGVRAPIVITKENVIAKGHGTLLAIKHNGWKEAPVVRQEFESEEMLYAYVQSDNAIAAWADLDVGEIGKDFEDYKLTLNPDLLGLQDFTPKDLNKDVDEDAAPEPPVEPVSRLGQLYELGVHRLLCGDSTLVSNLELLMEGKRADLVFTDPPYGVDYEGISNDHHKGEELRKFIRAALSATDKFLRNGGSYYVWHPDIHAYEFIGAIRDVGWRQARPSTIQWVKSSLVLSQGDYHSRNEPCLFGWKPGAGHKRIEDRTQDTIWECARPKKSDGHPTMKPIEICERAIINSSDHNNLVVDPFLGSGSTLIACEKTNRRCFGLELDPRYVDVIISRWETYTGKKARLLNGPT